MKKSGALLPLLFAAAGCASAPSGAPRASSAPGRAPYDAPPAVRESIVVAIDTRAAREILASLSRSRYDATDVKVLEDMPPIRLAIEDSGRTVDVFQRDFSAAFDPEVRTAVFDFATIRKNRDRWEALLEAVTARRQEIERMAADRAAALLPGDRPVSVRTAVYISFGLAGLADHMVVKTPDGTPAIIVDLARALGDQDSDTLPNQMSRLSRLLAGEVYRQAWAAYREASPAWRSPLPRLGPLESLVRVVAAAGPVALYGVDENFFPLSTWLRKPMERSIGELNRMAERLVEAEQDLEARVSLAAEIRRPDFTRRVAGPAGAYMEDAIIQTLGLDALRAALAAGPLAFFDAYDRATRETKSLPALSKVIHERLAPPAAKAAS